MTNLWQSTTARRHAIFLLFLSVLLIGIGTLGYMFIEGFTFLESIFMTVITLTSVGYGEVHPLDTNGRIFTIGLILMGAGFVAYNLTYFSRLMLDGNLLDLYRRTKLRRKLDQLAGHFIVCGFGQMGQIIVDELLKSNIPLVVIENEEALGLRIHEKGVPHLIADATQEEVLITAGIGRARGVVSVVSRDTENVFIVLTARDLNKDLLIISRASATGTEKRLHKAGADRVVSPFAIGAIRIAHNILRPTVTDFLELALSGEGMELSMEELTIPSGAAIAGKELINSSIRRDYNLIVVAIKRLNGRMIYNPFPQELLSEGDTLVIIGPQQDLRRFGVALHGESYYPMRPRV